MPAKKPEEDKKKNLDMQKRHDAAVELGHLGGIKGGPARKKALTKTQRHKIALGAAMARWRKHSVKSGKAKGPKG